MYKSTRLSCVIAAMACLVPVLACQASTAADSEVCVPFEGEDAKRCKELLETDQLLNKTYEKALGAVSNQEKKQLRNEQRQWLRFQRDDLCKTRDLPSEREAWFRELVNRPREAECVIHFTKVRIIQIEAKTPGSVTKVTNYTPETLAEFLKKQEFKISSRSAAPIAFCKRFLDSLIERVNIDYSRPLAQAMSLPDKSVDNVMKGCSPHSLTDAHYASGPVFRFYSSAGSESDKLRGILPRTKGSGLAL